MRVTAVPQWPSTATRTCPPAGGGCQYFFSPLFLYFGHPLHTHVKTSQTCPRAQLCETKLGAQSEYRSRRGPSGLACAGGMSPFWERETCFWALCEGTVGVSCCTVPWGSRGGSWRGRAVAFWSSFVKRLENNSGSPQSPLEGDQLCDRS